MSPWDPGRRNSRVDENQPAIVHVLRTLGVCVEHIRKPVDLALCHRGLNVFADVKNGNKRLTKAQLEFFEWWPGPCCVLRNENDVIAFVEARDTKVWCEINRRAAIEHAKKKPRG